MGCPMIGKIITADSNVKIVVFNLKMTSPCSSMVKTGRSALDACISKSRESTRRLLFSFSQVLK